METINIQAVYHKGVLKPQKKLDLPENTLVQLQVTPLSETNALPGSLFGAFPELAGVSEEELAWVRRQWEKAGERQARLVEEFE